MIKNIQTNEIFSTPFTSNKSWSLNSSGSIQTVEEGYFVSSSYNFYDSASAALYGFTASEQNSNGSYKRLVYQLVKNSYYKKAAEGKFDLSAAKKEFKECVKELSSDMDQIAFQKLVGRIEVLGELIIKHR